MNILVIAAHPDDEILGVGGTIAWHAERGDNVKIVIIAEGATSRFKGTSEEVQNLKNSAKAAAQILGATEPQFFELPDNRLDSADFLDVVQMIEARTLDYEPEIIYTHHGGDLNIDHSIVHRAVLTAFRPLPGSSLRRICGFETLSSTEWSSLSIGPQFNPNHFVDISQMLELKLKALESYDSEMRQFPHPRSYETVNHLAHLRGSQSGLDAAEAFEIILDIRR